MYYSMKFLGFCAYQSEERFSSKTLFGPLGLSVNIEGLNKSQSSKT